MATLTVQQGVRTGIDFTANAVAASAGGDQFAILTGTEYLVVYNGNGSSVTITFAWGTGGYVDGQQPSARTVTITTLHYELIGPWPPNIYANASGNLTWTYSAYASVTVMALRP